MESLVGPDAEATARLWLGAVAVEHALPRSALVRLGGDAPLVDAWIERSLAEGTLVRLGGGRELLLAVAPAREPLVVRDLTLRGELHTVARATRALLEGRSVADVTTALADGDLEAFDRRVAAPRLPHPAPRTPVEVLRRAIVDAFDPAWLAATFGDDADVVVQRVLEDAADAPAPCDPVRAWAAARLDATEPGDRGATALAGALGAHAILRGDVERADALALRLPPEGAPSLRAAARVVAGDLHAAQRLAVGAGPRGRGAAVPSLGPLLALVVRSTGARGADAAALKQLAGARTEAQRGAARAARLVLRTLADPDAPPRRLHVHQLGPSAGAWETLLTALAVHLGGGLSPTRASWAQHVTRGAVAYRAAGAEWLAAQALGLARALDPAITTGELARLGAGEGAPPAGGLSLWDLAAPAPEWRRALHALAAVAEAAATAEGDRRVAWFVDVATLRIARPALQVRTPEGGWTRGERTDVASLEAVAGALPPEDRRVLAAATTGPHGERELGPEAFEALVGHPRVVDGARGMARVEVVGGTCRVETIDDEGVIRVVVEPRAATAGVHVARSGESQVVVTRITDAMRSVMDVLPRGMAVPRSGEGELVEVLGRLAGAIEVRSPLVGAERDVPADATPCVRVAPHVGAWAVQIGVRPFGASGRFFVAGSGPASVSHDEGGRRLRTVRDLVVERARVERLVAACPTLARDPDEPGVPEEGAGEDDAWILSEADLLALLSEIRAAGEPCELEWPESPALRLRGSATGASLQARLRPKKGWYIATGGIRVDDVTSVALAELVRAPFVGAGRFVRLPGGDVIELEEKVRRVVAALRAASDGERGAGLRVHPGAVAALRDLAGGDVGLDLDDEGRAWLERLARRQVADLDPPAALRATLRSYQLDGYRWLVGLADLGLGACLADDMGLGKTVQIVALLLARAADGPAIVVAPTSVCSNWVAEIRRFAPSLEVVELSGPDRAAHIERLGREGTGRVAIASYATLVADADRLETVAWSTAVLDEAQFIKNAASQRARAACRLVARHRVAATGTPVENHLGDLWSIFHFLTPGLLGGWDAFRRRFARPIEQDDDEAARAALRAIVRPYVLRRTKAEVLAELPPITEIRHDVHLPEGDAMRYAWLRRQVHDKLFTPSGRRGNKIEVLAEITRLRRFCCHPRLVMPDAGPGSAKIAALLELAEELRDGGHRALVFSQYVDFLGLVREQLDERRIAHEYLDGAVPQAERAARVAAFQEGSATLFLVSLKAGGFGLNLTAADYVIHLDPWWNPAVEAQATDRAHRIGQERPVTVYRLVTRDTIEEKIVEMHAGKRRLARSILDEGGTGDGAGGAIDDEELAQLLGDDAPAVGQSATRRVTSS